MKTRAFATLVLLLCSAWAVAQSYPSDQKSETGSSGKATVQGCLSRSDSGYTLTDKSGTTYQLTGDTAKLSAHVGHEVQIKGTKAESGAAASTTASSQSGQPQLEVSGMKHISETCSSAPKSDKSSDKPMSEKPPAPKQ